MTIEQERCKEWREHLTDAESVELDSVINQSDGLHECFGRELRFGTGGIRGILGMGTNRMNIYVVRRATRGLAIYMKKKGLPLLVAISYDSRINSRLFAEEAARTLTSYGVEVWIYPRLEPTPALSYAVRNLGCGAGLMITASHNPAKYNGYKVYGPDGCQITDKVAEDIFREIQSLGYFDRIGHSDEERIHWIPESVLNSFIEVELQQNWESLGNLSVVYTPLNGTGLECVIQTLKKAGISKIITVPEQEQPDGTFPTCPTPNPEKKGAMRLGLALCKKEWPDLLLATDPDCDRVGVAVPDEDNYRLLNGNEVGVLLLDYICRRHVERGTMPQSPVAVTTVVSTEMADVVAQNYGVELRRTLTGFKYIGEQIRQLEKEGHREHFLFGFEESYGYLVGTHVRDKDAVNACLMICDMTAYYKRKNQTLLRALKELSEKYGYYAERLKTFRYDGIDGLSKMHYIMEELRKKSPLMIAGGHVGQVIDYLETGKTKLPASDVLEFRLENGDRVIIRPSGTEPQIKIYLCTRQKTKDQAEKRLEELERYSEKLV